MTTAPTFNLNASNMDFEDDEELQKRVAADSQGGKFIEEKGNYDLVVTAATFHENKQTKSIWCKGDDTWFNVKIVLQAADERQVVHYLQVPTTKIEFGEKNKLTMFGKWQEFMIGIGEVVTMAKTNALLTKYFTDPSKLVGQKVNADLGYEGAYVAKASDSDEYVIMVKGEPFKDDDVEVRLPDRSSAIQAAKSFGIEPSFIRVLKFTAKKAAKTSKASKAADDGW